MDILFLLGGLLLILLGANYLTDGASSLAKRLKVSDLVIGLTVVAFGTSAPELTVSISSALKGSADIAVGNVVGSNMFNTLMIVGCTALFAPIVVTRNTLLNEIPLCILSAIALLAISSDMAMDAQPLDMISRSDGILLLLLFMVFLSYTFSIARNNTEEEMEEIKKLPVWKSLLYLIGGLAALVYGGDLFIDGATAVARAMGLSESFIGITLVAAGTSLPELATSVVAAMKKNPEIAIGNAVGSNLFNIFLVLGATATISPLHIIGVTKFDLWSLVGASLLLWIFGVFYKKRTITRIEGSLLLISYVAYIVALIYLS